MTVFKYQTGDILLYGNHAIFRVVEYFHDSYVLLVVNHMNPLVIGETRSYNNKLTEAMCAKYFPNYNDIWWKLNETQI